MEISIDELEFAYSEVKILNGIDLKIESGECVSLLGPNGTGKSTLVKCILGLLNPDQGIIRVDNKNIKKISRKDLAQRISYVPQKTDSFFSLKVFDMVLLGRKPYVKWRNTSRDRNIALEAMKMLNIDHLAMKNFSELSGGQQQKVVIARAIAQEPNILVMDEATSNLDIRHQLEVMEIVKELSIKRGITSIMIVHDLNVAARYSDKIVIMNKGKIVASGAPNDVLVKDNIASTYGVEVNIGKVENSPCIIPLRINNVIGGKN